MYMPANVWKRSAMLLKVLLKKKSCDLRHVIWVLWWQFDEKKIAKKFVTSIEFWKLKYAPHTYTVDTPWIIQMQCTQWVDVEMLDHRQINIWFDDLFYGGWSVCVWIHSHTYVGIVLQWWWWMSSLPLPSPLLLFLSPISIKKSNVVALSIVIHTKQLESIVQTNNNAQKKEIEIRPFAL